MKNTTGSAEAEFADSLGADMCTTSLSYTTFDGGLNNHTYAQLDGKTAPMSIASTMATRKGMLVLNAAGNEGGSAWNFISVPADADSIITVVPLILQALKPDLVHSDQPAMEE